MNKGEKDVDREKWSKILDEVKPVENINKNPQNFLVINPVQKKCLIDINSMTMNMSNRTVSD